MGDGYRLGLHDLEHQGSILLWLGTIRRLAERNIRRRTEKGV